MAKKTEETTEAKAKPSKFKIPKTVGACADLLLELRGKKAVQQKIVDDIDEQIKALQAHLIETLPKSDQTGAVGKVAKALVKVTQEPAVQDWDAFYGHVAKTKSWDLLQRRVSAPAVKERWESGKQVPGVGTFPVVKVSVTKL